jgi:hypothetical protein
MLNRLMWWMGKRSRNERIFDGYPPCKQGGLCRNLFSPRNSVEEVSLHNAIMNMDGPFREV